MGNDRTANGGSRSARPSFGALLREYRVAAGLTQEELAVRSGLSARAIGNLERGRTARPFRSSAQFLARALALPEDAAEEFVAAAREAPPGRARPQRRPVVRVTRQVRVPQQLAPAAEMNGAGPDAPVTADPASEAPPTGNGATGQPSAGQRSAGRQSAGRQPEERWSAGQRPAEQWSAEHPSAGQTPTGQRSAQRGSAGQRPAGQRPTERRPAGQPPAEQLSAGQRPMEQPPTGQRSAQRGSAGQQPTGQQPTGRWPAGRWREGQGPAQLPADIMDFTGRNPELLHLQAILAADRGGDRAADPGAVRVVVIGGAAGLGKTTLAVHAAHRVRDLFPDGQLHANLAGTRAEPTAPGEVLARFLRDLGVDGDEVPASDEERAALYRTRLSGRRVLILLDDVKDAAQIRPLLPGSSSCAVLATTRNAAPSVVGTRFIGLDTLSDPEALELFSRIVGEDRAAAEPEATGEILAACAGLPLAVRVCAARLATRRRWGIAAMAARLRDERHRLDELQLADLEVRAGFQVSYDSLNADRRLADPARAFRLLGLWPGQKISLPAAAALTGEREADLTAALETLVDTNLLESPAPNWYRFHDLLRLFARELAQATESEEERDEAVARLLRWYLETALSAAECVSPHRYQVPPDEPRPATPRSADGRSADRLPANDKPANPRLTSAEAALAWYDSERASVITAIRQAAAAGLHDIAWRLATALFPLFNRRDNLADCITASTIALESARAAGNRAAAAWVMNSLGGALSRAGDPDGLGLVSASLALRREIGDRDGEAQSAVSLVHAYHSLHGPQTALEPSLSCLMVLREIGNPAILGVGLNNHGEICLELGRLDEAAEHFTEALSVWRDIGPFVQGHALHNLGRVYLDSGRPEDAIASLTEAHRLHLASGDLRGQAIALKHLGLARRRVGLADEARESLTSALRLFEDLKEDAEAEAIRRSLREDG